MDENLQDAVQKFLETGSLTPLVKVELKYKVQTKRMAEGKEELGPVTFREPEKFALTAEEERKRDLRRSSNRAAAMKCRKKKKALLEDAQKDLQEQRQRKRELENMVKKLTEKKEKVLKEFEMKNIKIIYSECPMEPQKATGDQEPTNISPSPQPAAINQPFNISPPTPGPDQSTTSLAYLQFSQEPYTVPSSYSTSITPPPTGFNPFEPAAFSHEMDPLLSYTQLASVYTAPAQNISRRASCTSTATASYIESPLHSVESLAPATETDLQGISFPKQQAEIETNSMLDFEDFLNLDEAQVPGYSTIAEDDITSSQELLTFYD